MAEINHALLRAYMMRGAATGPAEAEKPPVKYCAGKLDNGRPCRIVMLGDEDYCMRHKKEIEALEAGAPLPIGRVERQEDEEMAKHRCAKKNCTRAVKNEGDMCWQHKGLENQAEAGSVIIHDVNNLDVKPALKTVTSDNKLSESTMSDETFERVSAAMLDAALSGTELDFDKVMQNAVHENMDSAHKSMCSCIGDKTEPQAEPTPTCLACEGPVNGQDLFCQNCIPNDIQVYPAPPQEQIIPSATPRKGLAALIAVVPALPMPPIGLHIPFTSEELAILVEQEVTPEVVRQFVIMGLEQQLRPVVVEEDPLAKSRVRPEV